MLPCVPHLINIAQLGGLAKEAERGIWRAGEAVFAQESEILSEVPAERGLCQADSGARGGAGPAAFFHRKPGPGGSAEEQKYFGAQRGQAAREE